jgi:uncharacterized protein (DUF2225 family)
MTVLETIRLSCAVCSDDVISTKVVATRRSVRIRTDFHESSADAPALHYLVHMCARCGYAGTEEEFSTGAVNPAVREHVWDELAPNAFEGAQMGSAKFEAAAKIAIWQGAEPRKVGDLFLRAAWCCVDEGDVEAERYFRRLAAWQFEASLEDDDEDVALDERPVLTFLVGELWRRIGDRKLAGQWFSRVPDELTNPRCQGWIVDAARQQRDDPREWFE